MTKVDKDKLAEIELRWAERATRYPDAAASNKLLLLSVREVAGDMLFLTDRAAGRLVSLSERDRERVRNLDVKWREFEQNSRRSIDKNLEAPFGFGRLVEDVTFLAGLLADKPEPAAVN